MSLQVQRIGGWSTLALISISALLVAAPPDDCVVSFKPDFTTLLVQRHPPRQRVLGNVVLKSIVYGDHQEEAPAFEQLTLTLHSDDDTEKGRLPCFRIEQVGANRLQLYLGAGAKKAEIAPDFGGRLRSLKEKVPSDSIYQSIEVSQDDDVSLVITLSQTAVYRVNYSLGPAAALIILQTRSHRGPWIRMDPAIVQSTFGERSAVAGIEYRLPGATEHDVVKLLLRIRQSSGRERLISVLVPNVPIKLQDERYIAGVALQQLSPADQQQPSPSPHQMTPQPPSRAEAAGAGIAAFGYESLRNQAEAIRRKSGPSAREAFIFERLEAFARLEPSSKYKRAYRAIEESYSNANVSADDRFLFRLFANFASARLAVLNETAAAPEIPRAGSWEPTPTWNGQPRPAPPPLAEPVFEDSVWSWQQRQTAVVYNLGAHRAALHTRSAKEAFDSESLKRQYGNALVLEVAGSYTTPHSSIAALAARDGVIVGFLPRAWEGLVIIRDGRAQVVSALELSTAMLGQGRARRLQVFSVPEDFAEFLDLVRKNKLSFVQGHLLTLRGKYDSAANDTLSARRRVLMTGAGNDAGSVAVVDFADNRNMTLRQCAKWLGSFDRNGTALNLDTGTWDFGRVYSDSRVRSLGVETQSDEQLSNKFVFSRNVGSRNDG